MTATHREAAPPSPFVIAADQRLRLAVDDCLARELMGPPDEVIASAYRTASFVRDEDPLRLADISSGRGCLQIRQPRPYVSLFDVGDYRRSAEYQELREQVLNRVPDPAAASLVIFTQGLLVARKLRRARIEAARESDYR